MFLLSSTVKAVRKAVAEVANKATIKVMDWVTPTDKHVDRYDPLKVEDHVYPVRDTLNVKEMLKEPFECVDNYPKKLETGEWVDSAGNAVSPPPSTVAATEAELRAKIEKLDDAILAQKAKNLGVAVSPGLDMKTFILTSEQDVQEGTEKALVKAIVENAEGTNPSSIYLDITPSIRVWAAMAQQAAGSKMVIWSPGSVMNKITFKDKKEASDPTIMNERVFIEVDKARVFEEKNFLPEGFRKLDGGEISSVHIRDLTNPVQTVAPEDTGDDLDALTVRSPGELLTASRIAATKFASLRKKKGLSYAEALALSLEEGKLKSSGQVLTEDEVRSSAPEDPEMAKKRMEMLKKFTDETKKVREELTVERQAADSKAREAERKAYLADYGSGDCGPGCMCGLDKGCSGYGRKKE